MDLRTWTRIFLRQRDLIKKEILALKETKKGFQLTTRHGTSDVIIQERLAPEPTAHIISCPNTKENTQQLIKHWEAFSQQPSLLIIFANPATNEKWLIKPYHHNKIADPKGLKQGLLTLSETIPYAEKGTY